jgi:hypothetical protein
MIINILLILILTALSIPFSPWYFGAVIALVVTYFKPSRLNFILGFLGVGIAWLGYVLYFHFRNDGIITLKMAALFSESLGDWVNEPVLIIISVLIGGLVGGMGAMTGNQIKIAFQTNSNKNKRNKKSYKLKIQ